MIPDLEILGYVALGSQSVQKEGPNLPVVLVGVTSCFEPGRKRGEGEVLSDTGKCIVLI